MGPLRLWSCNLIRVGKWMIALALLLVAAVIPGLSRAQDSSTGVKVAISGLRNNKGQLVCSLWPGPEGFPRDDSHILKHVTAPIKERRRRVRFPRSLCGRRLRGHALSRRGRQRQIQIEYDRLSTRGLRIFKQRRATVQRADVRPVQVSLRRHWLEADIGEDDL